MAENIVLYRRWPKTGELVQYEFGSRSAYMHLVGKDGRRKFYRHYALKPDSMAESIRTIPTGTPVDPKDVPPKPTPNYTFHTDPPATSHRAAHRGKA